MPLLDMFRKKKNVEPQAVERKSYQQNSSFVDFLRGNGHYNLAAYSCMKYFAQVSPIKHAVGLQASGVASLTLTVRDPITKEAYPTHPVLSLLKKPNKEQTQQEFLNSAVSYLRASGYVGLSSVGDAKRPPLEINVIPSQYLNSAHGTTAPENITVNAPDYNDSYNLSEEKDLYRYYSDMRDRELYVVKEFNPQVSGASFFGMSELTPLLPEIEQFINANTHNLSLLERGARPSGILLVDDYLPDDQYERLREQMRLFYSGSNNAGRAMIGEKMKDFKELSQSNKDMDFAALKKDVRNSIYNNYKIPLALVNTESMTMDNLTVSQLYLYDNCVLPLAKRVLSDLTRMLMYRYPNSEGLEISYVESDIEALAPRRWKTVDTINGLNIASDNEIRAMVDMPDYQGGDTHYVPSNLIPVGENSVDEEKQLPSSGVYIKKLIATGKFTEQEAKAMANRFNLDGE